MYDIHYFSTLLSIVLFFVVFYYFPVTCLHCHNITFLSENIFMAHQTFFSFGSLYLTSLNPCQTFASYFSSFISARLTPISQFRGFKACFLAIKLPPSEIETVQTGQLASELANSLSFTSFVAFGNTLDNVQHTVPKRI